MRLVGINIPDDKRVPIALTRVHGIGRVTALRIVSEAGIDGTKRAKDLSPEEAAKIKNIIEADFKVEGELRQQTRQNINRLKNIKSYRGTRHAKNLPVRGQRTKTNTRTRKGNVRVTAGSGKRKLTLK